MKKIRFVFAILTFNRINYFKQYKFKTVVMAASFRNKEEIINFKIKSKKAEIVSKRFC